MAGRGPAPKAPADRRRTNQPERGEWRHASAVGWQFGPVPRAPTGLTKHSRDAWRTWFGAWFASFWTPDDLPGLRQMVRLYDQVERGEYQRHSELRIVMDSYAATPKGQRDARILPPTETEQETPTDAEGTPIRRLHAVDRAATTA